MAGTVVVTEITHASPKKIKFAWTSSGGGAADATTDKYYSGKLILITTDPGGTALDPDYDLTISDSDGVDLLAGSGADRHTTNTEHITSASLGCVVESKLTLGITAAGGAKNGTVYVYLR